MSFQILVADESLPMRRLVCRFLEAVGIASPQEATNGKESLETLKSNSFDLVIVDWNMSGAGPTGLELLKAMREANSKSLLMVMSTEADEEQISAAKAAGATEYLIKPFSVEARERLLELCQQENPKEVSQAD